MHRKWQIIVGLSAWLGLAAGGTQKLEVKHIMREKLTLAQNILEAVVTSNWVNLETNSRELERLTDDPRWTVLKYPEYAKHTAGFVKAIQALHLAAAQRDLEKTPRAYVDVTLKCVECHRYLARQRVAK